VLLRSRRGATPLIEYRTQPAALEVAVIVFTHLLASRRLASSVSAVSPAVVLRAARQLGFDTAHQTTRGEHLAL
jgi:hypothetical protein